MTWSIYHTRKVANGNTSCSTEGGKLKLIFNNYSKLDLNIVLLENKIPTENEIPKASKHSDAMII